MLVFVLHVSTWSLVRACVLVELGLGLMEEDVRWERVVPSGLVVVEIKIEI